MKNEQTGTSGLVEVTQGDRDAAAEHYVYVQSRIKKPHSDYVQKMTVEGIKTGRWDKDEAVQAFARHRLASLSPVPVGEVERLERVLDHAEAYEAPADGIAYGEHILRFADIRALIAALTASRPSDDGGGR